MSAQGGKCANAARPLGAFGDAKRPNLGVELTVPPELVTALADAVAERLHGVGSNEPPPADRSRLALSVAEAADALGMSADHFRRHVLPDLRVVRSGRLRLVPVPELDDWLERSAARALEAVA